MIAIPRRRLAELAGEAYSKPPTVAAGDVWARLELVAGAAVWSTRGTTGDPRDWLRDLSCLPWRDRVARWTFKGFLDGARAIMLDVAIATPPGLPIVFNGHSLGASLALELGVQFAGRGRPPALIVGWAPPHTGYGSFWRVLAHVDVELYRFRRDPVPFLPPTLGPARHRRPLRQIDSPAIPAHELEIDDHHVANYIAAAPA